MSIIHVQFTETEYAKRPNSPFDMDTWLVEGVEFLIQNNFQSRHHRTRHILHFAGSDNAHNHPDPKAPWNNTMQQKAHAYLSPQAICLSSSPQVKLPTLDAEVGDVFVGETPAGPVMLRITSDNRAWASDPIVEVLYCPPATVNHSEYIAEIEARRNGR